MRETLLALYRLQQIDSRVHEFEQAAAELPKQIFAIESALEKERVTVGTAHAEVDALKARQSEAEGQIREESAKLQKWKRRLSEIKTPREYQALSREVEQGERQVRDLEELVVNTMAELETKQKAVSGLSGDFKSRETEGRKQVDELRTRERDLRTKAAEAKQGRSELEKKVPPNYLKRYEDRLKKRGGMAIALASGDRCSGCNFVVRPQQMVEVRRLNSIEECPNCSRILVLEALVLEEKQKAAKEAQT